MDVNDATIVDADVGMLDVTTATIGVANVTTLDADTATIGDANVTTLDVTTATIGYADVTTLVVSGTVTLPANSLTTAVLGNFYYPLVLSGSVGGSTPITVPVALTRLPVDAEVGYVYFFSREISGTVVCGLYQIAATVPFTITEIVSPTVTLATELTIYAGTVVDSTLLTNQMVYLACSTEVLGSVNDVMVTLWMK
jgi:hypothetical protein